MALRERFGRRPFQEWPAELARRERRALDRSRAELAPALERFCLGQLLVLRQWHALKEHAHRRGLTLLGDLPIFVSADSADVWANPELFLLDEGLRPRVVAGVPPDYFSPLGQLWGNPIYDWEALERTGYRWWIQRMQVQLDHLDAIRLDHFRAFAAAWHVPVGAPSAQSGAWVPGPGAAFFAALERTLGGLPLLAEDLGTITPEVDALRERFQLPGMRVLQFAFDGDPRNPHLPENCVHNGVVYTGTHDNDTTRGWYDALPLRERKHLWQVLRRSPGSAEEVPRELIRLAQSTVAALTVIPCQDLLGLGSSARMNVPGRADGQWRWRCPEDARIDDALEQLRESTALHDRLASRAGNR
jgi:4-alpha-glucanotransferase